MSELLLVQEIWHEFMGSMILSATLKKRGYECRVLILDNISKIKLLLNNKHPSIVGINTMAGTEHFTSVVVRQAKALGVRTILGGTAATLYPEKLLQHTGAEYLCAGSGEIALPAFLDNLEKETPDSVEGIWTHANGAVAENGLGRSLPFSDLPWADRELYGRYGFFDWMPTELLVTRSCPNACKYCFVRLLARRHKDDENYFQQRPVDDLLSEAAFLRDSLIRRRKNKVLVLRSDNINTDPAWFEETLLRWPGEVGLRFITAIQVDLITLEQVKLLKRAGAFRLEFGLESGNEQVRNHLLGRPATNTRILEVARWLKEERIPIITGNMLALPGETLEQGLDTLEMNQRMGTKGAHPSIYQTYSGTRLHRYAIENGYLPAEDADRVFPTMHHGSLMKGPDVDALVNLHRLLIVGVKLRIPRSMMRWLARRPRNRIFEYIFLLSYSAGYIKPSLGMSWRGVLAHALHYARMRPTATGAAQRP